MKKLLFLVTMVILALSLTACAGKTQKDKVSIKCPACGYEGLDYIYQPAE